MRLIIKYKKVPERVRFLSPARIDRTRLARLMGVSKALVSKWITTGLIDEKYIPALKKIRLDAVLSYRKPYKRKEKTACKTPTSTATSSS